MSFKNDKEIDPRADFNVTCECCLKEFDKYETRKILGCIVCEICEENEEFFSDDEF